MLDSLATGLIIQYPQSKRPLPNSGVAAQQRRTYPHLLPDSNKRRRGNAGFGSPRLTPNSHDNETGLGKQKSKARKGIDAATETVRHDPSLARSDRATRRQIKISDHESDVTPDFISIRSPSPVQVTHVLSIEQDDSFEYIKGHHRPPDVTATARSVVKPGAMNEDVAVLNRSTVREDRGEGTDMELNSTSPYFLREEFADSSQFLLGKGIQQDAIVSDINEGSQESVLEIPKTPYFSGSTSNATRESHFVQFKLEGFGTQILTKAYHELLQISGDEMRVVRDDFGLVEKIPEDNIKNLWYEESVQTMHLFLKKPARKLASGIRLLLTLDPAENLRFIKLQQDHGTANLLLHKKGSSAPDKIRRETCVESALQLRGSPKKKQNTRSSVRSPPQERQTSPIDLYKTYCTQVDRTAINGPQKVAFDSDRKRVIPVDDLEIRNGQKEPGEWTQAQTRRASTRSTKSQPFTKTSEVILVYPETGPSVTLYRHDLERLEPDEFLNDSIVDFYLKKNYNQLTEQQKADSFVFSTFFYNKLTARKAKSVDTDSYDAVRKWTSKGGGVDLFKKKYVVVPINEKFHWYLAVIVNLDKVVFGDFQNLENEEKSEVYDDGCSSHTVSRPSTPLNSQPFEIKDDGSTETFNEGSIIVESPISSPVVKPPEPDMDFAPDVLPTLTQRITNQERSKLESSVNDLSLEDTTEKKSRGYFFSKHHTQHIGRDKPVILIFDSLKQRHDHVNTHLRDYLVAEARDKLGKVLDPRQISQSLADVPQQDNFSDCGLYLIQYTNTLLRQVKGVLTDMLVRYKFNTEAEKNKYKEESRALWEIDQIGNRRRQMRNEILAMSREWLSRRPKVEDHDEDEVMIVPRPIPEPELQPTDLKRPILEPANQSADPIDSL